MLVSCLNGLTKLAKEVGNATTELDEIYDKLENKSEKEVIIDKRNSQIYNFYENKTVLVTGATGYLGRTLIEKLLRTCKIKKLFVVLRPRKTSSLNERGNKIFDHILFSKMKEENPRWREQVEFIGGEALKECFGFTEETQAKIRSTVNIFFHEAATVRFDEELDFSLRVNVVGTIELIKFAKTCPNLKAFVHVSTAYSHAYMFQSEEKYYPTPINIKEMYDFLNIKDGEFKKIRAKEILANWKIDCMYTLTKAMAENYVRDCENIPIGVFKPSIVIGAYREPLRNWSDSMSGVHPYAVGVSSGIVHAAICELDNIIDLVPVDMTTNATIATAWNIAENFETRLRNNELPPVYNYNTGADNGKTWKEIGDMTTALIPDFPPSKPLYYYFQIRTTSLLLFTILDFVFHFMPALMFDTYLNLKGKQSRFVNIYNKVKKYRNLTVYFTTHEFKFDTTRSRSIWDKMTREDHELFFCDIRKLDWEDMMYRLWPGLRHYLTNDPMDNLEESKRNYKKLRNIHYSVITILGFSLLYSAYKLMYLALSSIS